MAEKKAPNSVRPEKATSDEKPDWGSAPLGSSSDAQASSKRPGRYSSVEPRSEPRSSERPPVSPQPAVKLPASPRLAHVSISTKPLAPASKLASLVSAEPNLRATSLGLGPPKEQSASPRVTFGQATEPGMVQPMPVVSIGAAAEAVVEMSAPMAVPTTVAPSAAPTETRSKAATDEDLGEWQQVWLAMQSRPWKSVAIVPADKSASDSALQLANALVVIGTEHLKQAMEVLDFRGVSLGEVEARINAIVALVAKSKRTLIVIGSILDSPACHRLARSADAALLCVTLGASDVASAKKNVEAIGKDRFLGTVAFRAPKKPKL